MNAERPRSADVRAFVWQLAPVQKKLEWELEAAKSQLAARLQQAAQAERALQQLEATHASEAAAAGLSMQATGDVLAHRRALTYLVDLRRHMASASAVHRHSEQKVLAARAECMRCQRRLDTLLSVRGQALDRHIQQDLRRSSNEADAAYIARRSAAAHEQP
jgi:hypothetical protein